MYIDIRCIALIKKNEYPLVEQMVSVVLQAVVLVVVVGVGGVAGVEGVSSVGGVAR